MASLKFGDLKDCVLPKISIDEFEPKVSDSDSIIVVAFNVLDKDVANDLDNYLDKSWVGIMDVDTAPHPLPDGTCMVFVEVARDTNFITIFRDLVKEVENLTGKVQWRVKVRGEEKEFDFDPDKVGSKVNMDGYVPMTESNIDKAMKFMKDSGFLIEKVDAKMKLTKGNVRLYCSVIHIGDVSTITESVRKIPVSIEKDRYETKILRTVLGSAWEVLQLKEHISLHRINTDVVLIVRI